MSVCAFLDATVLYPASLRNLLMRFTLAGMFQARWSADVHEEWIRSLLRNRPDLPRARLLQVRDAMDEHAADSLVVGYQPLIQNLHLPDPDDRHVLAAAIVGGAEIIVTHNLKDFPAALLAPHGLRAEHPDDFIGQLLNVFPNQAVEAVRDQQALLTRPPMSMTDLLAVFERIGLINTVTRLRRLLDV